MSEARQQNRVATLQRVSASGKVILAGEYAVLEGAPCLVMATDRRLVMDFIPAEPGQLVIDTAGLSEVRTTLAWQAGEWRELNVSPHGRFDLVVRLFNFLSKVDAFQASLLRGWHFIIDSRALFDADYKLGLGSSAALTVSLISGLWRLLGGTTAGYEQQWQQCFLAHNYAQQKSGSGADIAGALCGGVLCFTNERFKNECFTNGCSLAQNRSVRLQSWSVPDELHMAFYWSGKSAHTPTLLKRLDRWRAHHEHDYRKLQAQMNEVMQHLREQRNAHAVITTMKHFTQLLHHLDAHASVGIFEGCHAPLWQASRAKEELVYKTCGAGGGDLGLALSTCAETLADFSRLAQAHGATQVDLSVDLRGVHVH